MDLNPDATLPRSPLDPWLTGRTGLADVAALTPEAMEAWQMDELRRTLAWTMRHSHFHAGRLASFDLNSLRSHADLARLPRMDSAALDTPVLLAVSQDEVARVVTLNTSGSSGPPKRLFFTQADLERTLDFFRVGMGTLCRKGDTVLVLLPGRREWGVADLLARALPGLDARPILAPEGWTPETLPALIAQEAVTVLVAAPSQLRRLLDGPRDELRAMRAVLSTAEPLSDGLREAVQAAWGCTVFDHWGMTETGYGGGVECAAANGYHLREADLLVEVTHPATGEPLPPGETGEILITTLGPRALPLVRYRTGDAARMLPGPCPCGSPLRRLGRVQGRLAADGREVQTTEKNWHGWSIP
jgi:phenylacetate-CoA ligase